MRIVKRRQFMLTLQNKTSSYIIRLIVNDSVVGTYRVSKKIFLSMQKDLSPYKSCKEKSKKVKCVETGEIFNSAKQANEMLVKKGLSYSYTAYIRIKNACKNREETAYGFHWQFVDER